MGLRELDAFIQMNSYSEYLLILQLVVRSRIPFKQRGFLGVFDLMLSFVAILFGIGYTRLLNIVPDVFSKNEKSNLTFQLFYIYVFFAGILHFWGFTSNLGIENYDFVLFCLDVILSCTIYALCALTCPNNVEKIESWRDHYIKVRSKVWICQFLLIAN